MKTEKQLNSDILHVTLAIQKNFPELSRYIAEMPIKFSDEDGSEANIKRLSDYYDSLDTLLKNYSDCYRALQNRNNLNHDFQSFDNLNL